MTSHPNTPTKQARYATLVCARKKCHCCDGLQNPSDGKLAEFDSDQIGPWSQLHGDLDADLMIVGQDWGDVKYYMSKDEEKGKKRGKDDPQNPTMQNLKSLLQSIGLDLSLTTDAFKPSGVRIFLTNAILCLKEGGMGAKVDRVWFSNCGKKFLRPQIEIIAPRVVVTLGKRAYEAVLAEFGLPPVRGPLRVAVENPGAILRFTNGSSRLIPVYHCARRVIGTRSFAEQKKDWQRVTAALQ